jgi:sec-independent protein translocase protein TatC
VKLRLPFGRNKAAADPSPAGEMTLLGHLVELRMRLIRTSIAVVLACIVVYAFFTPVFDFLVEPYCRFRADAGADCKLIVLGPLESFGVRLTLAGYGGLILAMPVILYQMGRFVMPGLYAHEKKALIPFVGISIVLLLVGMMVAYLLLPRALIVLEEFGTDNFESFFSPREYLGFFVKMLFAFGIASEFPLVLIFLQWIGIVSPDTLAKNRRIAIVAVVILGAVITPTGDPFILAAISIPLYLFYEIAILVGRALKQGGFRQKQSSAAA